MKRSSLLLMLVLVGGCGQRADPIEVAEARNVMSDIFLAEEELIEGSGERSLTKELSLDHLRSKAKDQIAKCKTQFVEREVLSTYLVGTTDFDRVVTELRKLEPGLMTSNFDREPGGYLRRAIAFMSDYVPDSANTNARSFEAGFSLCEDYLKEVDRMPELIGSQTEEAKERMERSNQAFRGLGDATKRILTALQLMGNERAKWDD